MDIVTLAMNLYSQGVDPQLDLSNPDEMIRFIRACTGPAGPSAPSVDRRTGVHRVFGQPPGRNPQVPAPADRRRAWQVACLPIDPRDLGRDYRGRSFASTASPGKGGVAFVLERDYGLTLPRWMQVELAQIVQRESESTAARSAASASTSFHRARFANAGAPVALTGYRLHREQGVDRIEARHQRQWSCGHDPRQWRRGVEAFVNAWTASYGNRIASSITPSTRWVRRPMGRSRGLCS